MIARALRGAGLAARRLHDDSGNVAIITAMMMPVLISAAGFGMDFAYAAYVKQKLNKAAQAAVIGAVSQTAATSGGGYADLSWLRSYGLDIFLGNASQLSIGTVTPTLTVASNGANGVVANVSYSASVPTLFSAIIGINSIAVSGTASATATAMTYINYYILVDVSQSMGIGATATDMSNLYNRVKLYNNGDVVTGELGCVFGCHVKASYQSTYTNEYLAHNISPTITLRLDAAVSAVQGIIGAAQTAAGTNKNIKIGLYTMSENPVSGTLVNTISSPSSNYTSLTSLAATIDLGNNTSAGLGDSDFVDQLAKFNTILPANGSGASALSPLNYVFLVTDGLVDTPGLCPPYPAYGHCNSAFDPSYCTSLKAKATVGVIYTTYLPIYNQNNSANGYENDYQKLAQPYVSQIAPNLQSCATAAKYYFEASDGPAIASTMLSLFQATQQAAILTH